MIESERSCPTCRRQLAPRASRCFYCGPAEAAPPEAALAVAPDLLPDEAPSGPNTLCPICKAPAAARAGVAFTCPSCRTGLECLFAGAATAAAPAPVPVSPLGEVCTFHPKAPAVARCRTCRKAVCETCAFRAKFGTFCGDCAAEPDPVARRSIATKGALSLTCGILGLLCLGGTFVTAMSGMGEGPATLLILAALVLGLAGVVFGFTSRDPVKGRSLLGLIGIILNFLVLGIYALLIVAGAMMEDS